MKQLQMFNHNVFGELPVIVADGAVWFGAMEAAMALSITNPVEAIKNSVYEDELEIYEVTDQFGRSMKKEFTNELGLYALIINAAKQANSSDIKTKTKAYKRWITSEVLPAIRRSERYVIDVDGLSPLLWLMIQIEYSQRALEAALQQKIEPSLTVNKDALGQRDEDWRNTMNSLMKRAAYRMGGNYQELRRRSYDILEERARCDLDKRLGNLLERLVLQGATKTQLKNTTRMTVIEADPKLKEIYTTIVKELL